MPCAGSPPGDRPIILHACRSTQLAAALVATALVACAPNHSEGPPPPDSTQAAGFLDTLEERTFHYFWDLTNTTNGLTPDRSPIQ